MIAWLVETFAAVSALMLLVLLIRGPVARSFGAGWAYALWAVPALRLVLPPLPQLAPDLTFPPVALFIPTAAEMTAPLPAAAGPGQWVPLILALWAGGAVIFLTLQWLAYRTFLGALRETARPARPPLFGGIRTWISEAVTGPIAMGLVERRIVLPGDFMRRYSPTERRLALEHELVHHRRGDLWANLAAMVVVALFWFNPIAWIALRGFRSDQELACDAAVARGATIEERCDYARALVKSASRPGLIAISPLNPGGQLKRRLKMMRSHRASPLRSLGGTAALTAFALAGFAVGSGELPPSAAAVTRIASSAALPVPAVAGGAPASLAEASTIVVTAPRSRAAARSAPAGRAAPLAIASALPRESTRSTSLAAVLKRLPPVSLDGPTRAAPGAPQFAFHVPVPGQAVGERHVFRVVADGENRREFVVVTTRAGVPSAEVQRAVVRAVAEARAARERHDAEPAPAGSGDLRFDINIQTIEQGE